ncbi:MAG: hypothetical protein R2797_12750 [Gelidibacter sp.]
MKTYITLFALVTLFFVGSYSAAAQIDKKSEQNEYAIKKRQMAEAQTRHLTPETIAEQQTENLKELLNLDERQEARIYEICLSVERKMAELSNISSEEKRMDGVKDLESVKNAKIKEALTEEQYTTYLNSLTNEK